MDSGRRDVLLVEDEATFRRVIAQNLSSRGLSVREAGSAAEAVAAVNAQQPDLMVLDLNLPDRTGWDILRDLKGHGQDVPTIIVSAVRVRQGRLNEFHPLAYLPKPFPLEALLRVVSDMFATPVGGTSALGAVRAVGDHVDVDISREPEQSLHH
jgi:DNA-binding response OmpR family regulator